VAAICTVTCVTLDDINLAKQIASRNPALVTPMTTVDQKENLARYQGDWVGTVEW
jgi:hypothetical protein